MITIRPWRSLDEFRARARADLAHACNAALCARLRLFVALLGGGS